MHKTIFHQGEIVGVTVGIEGPLCTRVKKNTEKKQKKRQKSYWPMVRVKGDIDSKNRKILIKKQFEI